MYNELGRSHETVNGKNRILGFTKLGGILLLLGIVAILTTIILIIILVRRNVKFRALTLLRGIKWDMVVAIVGVMIFKDVVIATGFLNEISSFLIEAGIPLVVLAVIFPLITGLAIGSGVRQ